MSILVRKIEYNGRKAHMLYYPGMTKQEAQHLADQINGGMLAKREPLNDADIERCYEEIMDYQSLRPQDARNVFKFARAIEAAHGITGEKE